MLLQTKSYTWRKNEKWVCIVMWYRKRYSWSNRFKTTPDRPHHNEKPFPAACSFLKCQTHSFEAILWYILLGIGLSYRELAETKIPSLGIFNRVEQTRLERSKLANFVKYCKKTELFSDVVILVFPEISVQIFSGNFLTLLVLDFCLLLLRIIYRLKMEIH